MSALGPAAQPEAPAEGSATPLHEPILNWYETHARDLPWRRSGVTSWAVLVSEVMLQQTPVRRVEPIWRRWMQRWPTPADLAAESSGEAVRAWDRLGYPRRALRLHACAIVITQQHAGQVPAEADELLALPGVGAYTAAAVAAFAFGERTTVVDTNVRRVLARAITGQALPSPSLTARETKLAHRALPTDRDLSVRWNVAAMELGALICTAKNPRCGLCPVQDRCAWVLAGSPPHNGPSRTGQAWHGTDRQCRGRLLHAVREHDGWLPQSGLEAAWTQDAGQRERCLQALVDEGLLQRSPAPSETPEGSVPQQSEPQQSAPQSLGLQSADWYGFVVD